MVLYICWRYDVHKSKNRVPINDDETMAKFGQRRYALEMVEITVYDQEKWFGDGEECKEWFKERLDELPVQELEHCMELVDQSHVIRNLSEGWSTWREQWFGPTQETILI